MLRHDDHHVLDRSLQEPDTVVDELDRRVDLVRDAGCKSADGLELLRLTELELELVLAW